MANCTLRPLRTTLLSSLIFINIIAAATGMASAAFAEERNTNAQLLNTIQPLLKGLEIYTGTIDGVTGPRTRAAISEFERRAGLNVDGYLDQTDLAVLEAAEMNKRNFLPSIKGYWSGRLICDSGRDWNAMLTVIYSTEARKFIVKYGHAPEKHTSLQDDISVSRTGFWLADTVNISGIDNFGYTFNFIGNLADSVIELRGFRGADLCNLILVPTSNSKILDEIIAQKLSASVPADTVVAKVTETTEEEREANSAILTANNEFSTGLATEAPLMQSDGTRLISQAEAEYLAADIQRFVQDVGNVFGVELVVNYELIREFRTKGIWDEVAQANFALFTDYVLENEEFNLYHQQKNSERAVEAAGEISRLKSVLSQLISDRTQFIVENPFLEESREIYDAIEQAKEMVQSQSAGELAGAIHILEALADDNAVLDATSTVKELPQSDNEAQADPQVSVAPLSAAQPARRSSNFGQATNQSEQVGIPDEQAAATEDVSLAQDLTEISEARNIFLDGVTRPEGTGSNYEFLAASGNDCPVSKIPVTSLAFCFGWNFQLQGMAEKNGWPIPEKSLTPTIEVLQELNGYWNYDYSCLGRHSDMHSEDYINGMAYVAVLGKANLSSDEMTTSEVSSELQAITNSCAATISIANNRLKLVTSNRPPADFTENSQQNSHTAPNPALAVVPPEEEQQGVVVSPNPAALSENEQPVSQRDYTAAGEDNSFSQDLTLGNTGNVAAQYRLGNRYYYGQGVSRDYLEAAKWYELAANHGNADAQFKLGEIYLTGQLGKNDVNAAMNYFQLAAEQGHKEAQYDLGVMYFNGDGVARNRNEAFKWISLAAEQGHIKAQYNLGVMYNHAYGVNSDIFKAAKWYTLAAKQGHVRAQSKLSVLYYIDDEGGALQDFVLAYMWANIAALNGSSNGANSRDSFASLLSQSDLEKAQELVNRCMSSNYEKCGY